MKYIFVLATAILFSILACKETPVLPGDPNNPPQYSLEDFKKLKWIEGNWYSQVSGPGFYQAISFLSDTTLQICSYEFNGKDTSKTTLSTLYWRDNHLYIGPNKEWVAVLLDKKKIQLDPVRPGWQTIIWEQNSPQEWTMTHRRPDFVRTIKMKKDQDLSELLKK